LDIAYAQLGNHWLPNCYSAIKDASMSELITYTNLLTEIKNRIAQTRAVLAVNAELIQLYWQIGQLSCSGTSG
jgi:hypothetical protein